MKHLILLTILFSTCNAFAQDNPRITVVTVCDSIMLKSLTEKCMIYSSLPSDVSRVRCEEYAKLNGACMVYKRVDELDADGKTVSTVWYRIN